MPITWKNVNGPSVNGISLQSASKMITGGLDKLSSAAKDYAAGQADAWKQEQAANTDNVLAQIAGVQDMAQYDALKQSLTPDALQQKFGAQVDTSKIFDALNARDNQLMTDQTDRYNYQQTLAEQAADPLRQKFQSLLGANDYKGAKSFLDANAGAIPNAGELYNSLETNQRSDTEWQRKNDAFLKSESANNILTAIGQEADPIAARAKALQMAKDANITGGTLVDLMSKVDGSWGTYNNLSAEQTGLLQATQDQAMAEFDRLKEIEQRSLDQIKQQNPVDEVYAYSDQQGTSEADGIKAIIDLAPKDTTFNTAGGAGGVGLQDLIEKDVLPAVRKRFGLKDNATIPGAVLQEAAKGMTTENEWVGGDEKLDTVTLQRRIVQEMERYNASRANLKIQNDAQTLFDTNVKSLYDTAISQMPALKKQFQDSNAAVLKLRN